MDIALGPLDIVERSKEKEKNLPAPINTAKVSKCLEGILQNAVKLVQDNAGRDFLYKNPNGSKGDGIQNRVPPPFRKPSSRLKSFKVGKLESSISSSSSSDSNSYFFGPPSCSTSSEDYDYRLEPWILIKDFKYPLLVHQINEFVATWELTPATKYVIIAMENKIEHVPTYGDRYFVEAHFSQPTPRCPNPLAVAKVYFTIHVSNLLPNDYPVNVTYQFEGYKTVFSAMGKNKIKSNKFQNYFISTILQMKLAFYAKLCDCRNPISPLKQRKKSMAELHG